MKLTLYQVDAFTETLFEGNPAAVCILDSWLPYTLMQNIAAENNLAETCFLVKTKALYEIRWFTPTVEVDLCGHATLAAAYVLANYVEKDTTLFNFYSHRSGPLSVSKANDGYFTLNFPADQIHPVAPIEALNKALGTEVLETWKGATDYMVVLPSQNELDALQPDLRALSKLDCRGVIVTAQGTKVDFVSRFFAPQSGIDEDPVTGSAHCTLTPYWTSKLNKKELTAQQRSKRGGNLHCELLENRVNISGKAILYMKGEIEIGE